MTKTELTHKQEMKVVKDFYRGIDLFNQGYDCPTEVSAVRRGWLAGKEMDEVKKKWLADTKESFID